MGQICQTVIQRQQTVTVLLIVCILLGVAMLYQWSDITNKLEKHSVPAPLTRQRETPHYAPISPSPSSSSRVVKRCYVSEESTADVDAKLCVDLNTKKGPTPICIYPPAIDIYISSSIAKYHFWEQAATNAMQDLMIKNPRLNLIDVGANIGVYTLIAAKLYRKVVAVEANVENVKNIYKSINLGNFQNLVTICSNAISDVYTTVQVDLILKFNNIGGNTVQAVVEKPEEGHRRTKPVSTIKMDDLLEVITFKKAILKIDIEGYEPKAFSQARKLFDTIDIQYIFMEWRFVATKKKVPEFQKIYDFFRQRKYSAYPNSDFKDALGKDFIHWPNNVYWKKYSVL